MVPHRPGCPLNRRHGQNVFALDSDTSCGLAQPITRLSAPAETPINRDTSGILRPTSLRGRCVQRRSWEALAIGHASPSVRSCADLTGRRRATQHLDIRILENRRIRWHLRQSILYKAIKTFPLISLIRGMGSDDLHDAIFDVNDVPDGGLFDDFEEDRPDLMSVTLRGRPRGDWQALLWPVF
jgi:hypothetical protein